MAERQAPIGIFDSGLGGLTVLEAVSRALPDQDLIYLGDNANAPYGAWTAERIYRLTQRAVERLFSAGCRLVVVACNTACATALRRLQQEWLPQHYPQNRVIGVFVPLLESLTGNAWDAAEPREAGRKVVWFFATTATVRSGAFSSEARRLASSLSIHEQPCPGLVDAIERGDAEGAEAIIASSVEEARRVGRPTDVVLGCTHYPLLRDAFARNVPEAAHMLSQPEIVAESLGGYLQRHPQLGGGQGQIDLMTSGDPTIVAEIAGKLLGRALPFRPAAP